jgi:cardiolipin synthase
LWLVVAAVASTPVAVLVAVNFVSGEKKIQYQVTRLYTMEDPRFRYELGLLLLYLLAITAASRSIDLSASYFVPDDLAVRALVEAMQRGVRLRIGVPREQIDSDSVLAASRARWGPWLKAGAVIAEYRPTMLHCKVIIIDNLLVSVGSANFDNRSFRLNDKATLKIQDGDFARQQTGIFEEDLRQSRRISYDEWQDRPMGEKLGERLASLLGSQL